MASSTYNGPALKHVAPEAQNGPPRLCPNSQYATEIAMPRTSAVHLSGEGPNTPSAIATDSTAGTIAIWRRRRSFDADRGRAGTVGSTPDQPW